MNRITELIKEQIHPITGWQYVKSRDNVIIYRKQKKKKWDSETS